MPPAYGTGRAQQRQQYTNAIYKEEATNTLWFGTRNGVSAYDLGQHRYRTYFSPPADTMRGINAATILRAADGALWVATFSKGLLRLSPDGQRLLGHYDRATAHLPTDQFTYLLFDPVRNVLWASTRDAGLLKLRPTASSVELLAQYKYAPGQPNSLLINYVWPLLLGEQGVLWMGTGVACTSSLPMPRAATTCGPSARSYPKPTWKACCPTMQATCG